MTANVPPGFARGTLINTRQGPVAIEDLRPGDLVVTATNGLQPIRWIGWRHLDPASLPEPERRRNRPVLIKAGAIGTGMPYLDLTLSSCHCVMAGARFLSAGTLVDGETILALDDHGPMTCYHVELPGFQILVANGMGAESFVDVGKRGAFEHQLWDREPAPARRSA